MKLLNLTVGYIYNVALCGLAGLCVTTLRALYSLHVLAVVRDRLGPPPRSCEEAVGAVLAGTRIRQHRARFRWHRLEDLTELVVLRLVFFVFPGVAFARWYVQATQCDRDRQTDQRGR
jgi:hypothetical protein